MKRTFAKLLAMLLMLALVLTGCNLVDVDQVAVVNQELESLKESYSAVLAEYDGGTVTKFDAMAPFSEQYSQMAQLYAMFGMEMDVDTVNSMLQDVVMTMVMNQAIAKEFDARGLSLELTEEEIRAEAEKIYQSAYDYYAENVTGDTEEIKKANVEYRMYADGYTLDALYANQLNNYKAAAVQTSVRAEIAEVTDEELQTAYEEELAADEETYTSNPNAIEADAADSEAVVAWRPEGYRTVKHILLMPEEALRTAVTDARSAYDTAESELESFEAELDALNDDDSEEAAAEATEEPAEEARTAEAIQADIDAKKAELPGLKTAIETAEAACLEAVKEKTEEIYAKLEAGEDFDALMAEYGEDPGMQSEPAMSTGYYVSADSTNWDPYFAEAAMALTAVGDYSAEPVVTGNGVHIVYYNSDVVGGPVALEEIRDALYAQTLENMQAEHYTALVEEWLAALNPVYHMENWATD